MTDVPAGTQTVLYAKNCSCEDATAGTGRLKVHMNPDKVEPGTRELSLSIQLMELTCNVCDTPWTSHLDYE